MNPSCLTARTRRLLSAATLTLSVAALSACDGGPTLGSTDELPTTLVASPAYVGSGESVHERLAALQRAIDELRGVTGSGWVGRQDDVTGYLGELSGGRFAAPDGGDAEAASRGLMEAYGPDLFGIGAGDLELAEPAVVVQTGAATVRAEQQLAGVPVLDGALVFTVGSAEEDARVNGVRGRVFPGLDVSTQPTVRVAAARRRVERVSGGTAQARPRLVVLPDDRGGTLTWEVPVAGVEQTGGSSLLADGVYYLDAHGGEVVTIRPSTAEASLLTPRAARRASAPGHRGTVVVPLPRAPLAAADGPSVEVSGQGPNGDPLTAHGVSTPEGVRLSDTTTPFYDPETGRGAIETYDMRGGEDTSMLPGVPYVEPGGGTVISDPEALASQSISAAVIDYYHDVWGRSGWDGEGGTLIASVNGGDGTFCNSYFTSSGAQPQMFFGNPCAPGGEPLELTEVEIDTAAHEITHGVTSSTADLVYAGQSGALNEAYSDYLGNVIGNAYKGTDGPAIFEGSCEGFTEETPLCARNEDGSLSLRYMLEGTTYDDYLRVLNPGFHLFALFREDQDHGGVHLNSAIWNNALWSIRTRLAQIDGVPGNESALAAAFDAAVYDSLVNRLTATAGFADARQAVEEAIVASGSDPVVLRVARETFDQNRICPTCGSDFETVAQGVATSPETQVTPAVHGDQVAWVGMDAGGLFGRPTSATVDGSAVSAGGSSTATQVVFAGDALVTFDQSGNVTRYAEEGAATLDTDTSDATFLAGLGGSDDGAAWISGADDAVRYVDAAGTVTSGDLAPLGGDFVWAVGSGGGTVALGTEGGQVATWAPGGAVTPIGQVGGSVVAVAAYGDRVLAVADDGTATLFTGGGDATTLSTSASPFGATMSAEHAVWVDEVGVLGGGVAEATGAQYPDTDLRLHSLTTGTTYALMEQRGQQGFPALSGDRLVWQDAAIGGDDILTATVPDGL